MSRSTIDVGIDLGTTNSSIARLQQGMPFVIPNNDGAPATPSVVRVNASGTTFIGKRAYDFLVSDPDNTVGEFKRWMGTDQTFTFRDAGKMMSATQLSALILQSLRSDLQTQGDKTPAAVITVPAAFDLNQCAATQDAARIAGIEHAPLLQEPVAASLAYGYRLDLEGQAWLVYDLGGGTFDLALVGVRDGRVQVLDHEGDNYLGGKDFDWQVVERLLVPRLAAQFNVASFRRDNAEAGARRNLAMLKALAESVKIELSRDEHAVATTEVFAKPMTDDDGKVIEVDINVSRSEYDAAVEPLVAKTVTLARQLLERHEEIKPEAVLMVGGPTLTPLVRRLVSDGLRVRVDTSANPLTVVAEGAALYAATQPLPKGISVTAIPQAGVASLELVYKALTDDESQLVGCVAPDPVATVEFSARDGSWASGQLACEAGKVSTRVPLPVNGPHTFEIIARSRDGAIVRAEPGAITVTRGLTAVAAPLSRAIGVVVDDGSGEQEVQWLLQKNTPLPARGVYEFKTTIALEPGGEIEILQIHIVEGHGDSARPQRQRRVGELTITDRHVSQNVPAGNPVEVRIDISESRTLAAEAYLPLLDETFRTDIEIGSDVADAVDLRSDVEAERGRLSSLVQHIPAATSREINEALREAENVVHVAQGGDRDSAQRAMRTLQQVQRRIDEFEDAQRLPLTIASARKEADIAGNVVMEYGGDGHRARHRALRVELDEAIEKGSVSEVNRVSNRFSSLFWEVVWNQITWWAAHFNYLSGVTGWTDASRADECLRQGRLHIVQESLEGLREACFELRSLLRPEDQARITAFQNVGIRR